MTTKQYLSLYRKYMSDIVFFESMKAQVVEDVASLKSPQLGDKVQTSPENDPIGNLVIEIERDIAKFNLEIVSCKAKMFLIDSQIMKMREYNEDYYKILAYRYKIGLDWQDIASRMYMGLSTVTHLHSPALQKFEELFGDNYITA